MKEMATQLPNSGIANDIAYGALYLASDHNNIQCVRLNTNFITVCCCLAVGYSRVA